MDKPKRSEAQLRALAEGRKRSLETRAKKKQARQAEQEKRKKKLETDYETKVLKKKDTPPKKEVVEETDKEIHERPKTIQDNESDDEYQVTNVRTKSAKPKAQPNYKQMYYQHKLALLQQQQEEIQYARAPPHTHMTDIAKSQIKNKVDSEVMKRVYAELFPSY
jgi:AAA15 family ATPase/GTPase